MLPRWLGYYGEQCGFGNLLVLDDSSDDGSTDDLPCPRLRVPPGPWKAPWAPTRLALVNGVSRGLLACYDTVIFTDADEFLVPDPARYDGLVDYLASNREQEVIAPLALNVLHKPDLEPALRSDQPLLRQRRCVKFIPGLCKPLVKRVAANWSGAFHAINARYEIDRRLLMLHLKYCDIETLTKRSEDRHAVHQEGRGHSSSAWALESRELLSRLMSWVATPYGHEVAEFDPAEPDLTGVVHAKKSGFFRSQGQQLTAMDQNPLRQPAPARPAC